MNLTYINSEGSPKVKRWKLFVQEYNFDVVQHIKGTDNVIADALSRLCLIWDEANDPSEEVLTALLRGDDEDVRIPDAHYNEISLIHNSRVGHVGFEKCLKRLRVKGLTWPGQRRHLKRFLRHCPLCQKLSAIKPLIKTHPFTTATYEPWDVINIDTIGPLKKDEYGNCYILNIIDCFSRWVELYAIPDTTAAECAKVLIQHCGRFGVPDKIRSDRGSQFVNETIAELTQCLGSEQELSTSYSHEENAIVERSNKEVMRHLRAIIFDDRVFNKWSTDQLPLVQRILNAEENINLGVSPAEILFGGVVNLNRQLLSTPSSFKGSHSSQRVSDHMAFLMKRQELLLKVARETQRAQDNHRMSEYDPGFTEYPVNSYVLYEHPEGPLHKLKTKNRGPYRVINIVGSEYTVVDLLNGKEFSTHISNLRPFNYDSHKTDPKDVAMHDAEEFEVESILSHRGDKTRRSTMEFLVRWTGYGPEEDKWLPYENVRDTEQLIRYLTANRMKSLIPAKFKD
jgi:hypothetical protein